MTDLDEALALLTDDAIDAVWDGLYESYGMVEVPTRLNASRVATHVIAVLIEQGVVTPGRFTDINVFIEGTRSDGGLYRKIEPKPT